MQNTHPPRMVLFGGSFDPVHRGHLEMIDAVLRDGAEHVFVVPAARSPFKNAPQLLPADLRFDMLRAALRGMPRVSVLDLEIRRPPPSYTVDTLEALGAWLPRARWSLVLGADAYAGFAQWRRAERILERCELLLFSREAAAGTAAESSRSPEAPASALPEPWRSAARPGPAGSLQDVTGRMLLRRIGAPIAAVSSSGIRAGGNWADVPPGARELLAIYEQAHPSGTAPRQNTARRSAQEPPCSASA